MNEIDKKNKFLLSLCLILTGLIIFSSITGDNDTNVRYNSLNPRTEKKPSNSHTPLFIHIDGSIPGNWSDTATKKPWCWGSGTSEHPYVIENCTIDASTLPLGPGIFINNSRGVHFIIRNCSVINSASIAGIYLKNVTKGQLFSNNCSNNDEEGLLMQNCNDTRIEKNLFLNNIDCGIQMEYSNNNTLFNNTAKNTGTGNNQDTGLGMYYYCNDNLIEKNRFEDNEAVGIYSWHFNDRNKIKNNILKDTAKGGEQDRGIQLRDQSNNNTLMGNIAIDNSISGIWITENCDFNYIQNTTACETAIGSEQDEGITISNGCDGNILVLNNMTDNLDYGLFIFDNCANNTIRSNTATSTSIGDLQDRGIHIYDGCHNNTITNNTVMNNDISGISLDNECDYNIISDNSVYSKIVGGHQNEGIVIFNGCDNNTIIGNNASQNLDYGLYVFNDCENNTITQNWFMRNGKIGTTFNKTTGNNTIYMNAFVQNPIHAYDNGTINHWNITNIGNFWDNYTGNDIDPHNGIGDTPFSSIDGESNSIDYFPLMDTPLFNGSRIHVDENGISALNWSRTSIIYSWCSGKGTYTDPYVLDGLKIDAKGIGSAIIIANSSEYFELKNCIVENSGSEESDAGIKIINVNNSRLINNDCTNNGNNGMYITDYCTNNSIINNDCINNGNNGTYLAKYCSNNSIINNNFINNGLHGISIYNHCDNNAISNNTANDNADNGIKLEWYCDNNIIRNSTATDTENGGDQVLGILLRYYCDNNTILDNNVNDNNQYGIYLLDYNEYNLIKNNTACDTLAGAGGSHIGIYLSNECDHNRIIENNANDNENYGIYLYDDCDYNYIANNSASDIAAGYLQEIGIYLQQGCDHNNISENAIRGNNCGLKLEAYCNITKIEKNTFFDNSLHGIFLYDHCDNNTISNNTANDNADNGIRLEWYCDDNIIKNNTATDTENGGDQVLGILLRYYCDNNTILDNNVNDNNQYGIYLLDYNEYNLIKNNTACDTLAGAGGSHIGIYLSNECDHNRIIENNANDNENYGIYLYDDCDYNYIANNSASDIAAGYLQEIGIYLQQGCDHNNVSDNIICDLSQYGIHLQLECSNNIIRNNSASNNGIFGIYLSDLSNNSHILNNSLFDNSKAGIFIDNCSKIVIQNNTMMESGLHVEGNKSQLVSHVVINNTINNLILYCYSNENQLSSNNFTNAGQIILINCNNSLITGLNISHTTTGLYLLQGSSNNTIRKNNFSENTYHGLLLNGNCNNNTFLDNIANDNAESGLKLENHCNYNIIRNNTARDTDLGKVQDYGAWLSDYCNKNSILANNFSDNSGHGIYLLNYCCYNLIKNNTACDTLGVAGGSTIGICIIESDNNRIINNSINENQNYGIYLSSSDNNLIINNTACNLAGGIDSSYGIILAGSCNNIIRGNIANENRIHGIYLSHSSNNLISNNSINNNLLIGIYLRYSCEENEIRNNNINENGNYGIQLEDCNDNVIANCSINNNDDYGIYILDSDENVIINNTICNTDEYSNQLHGIYMRSSDSNSIISNNISNNADNGIRLRQSINNNIINNTIWNTNWGADQLVGIYVNLMSTNNVFLQNSFLNNTIYGIGMNYYCDNNVIKLNTINGSNHGVDLDDHCDNNNIIGNLFYNNTNKCHDEEASCNGNLYAFNLCNGTFDRIYIDDDDGIQGLRWIEVKRVVNIPGAGTWEDPYVLANLQIDNNYCSNCCILIRDSVVYFIIQGFLLNSSGNLETDAAIKLVNTSNGWIINNNCSGNGMHGIFLYDHSNNNTIENNIVNDNYDNGIRLESYCDNNIIRNNTATDTGNEGDQIVGILLHDYCDNNSILDNDVNDNDDYGIYLLDYNEYNLIKNNTACDTLGGAGGSNIGIYLRNECDHNRIIKNNANDNEDYGIYLYDNCDYNCIANNSASDIAAGYWQKIALSLELGCAHNNISGNSFNGNSQSGIQLHDSCNENIITNNSVNNGNFRGILLWASCKENLLENNIVNNQDYGIWISSGSNDNEIIQNRVENNNLGIYVQLSDYNNISENSLDNPLHIVNSDHNDIIHNYMEGCTSNAIYIDSNSDSNIIKHNIFVCEEYPFYNDQGTNSLLYGNHFLYSPPKIDIELIEQIYTDIKFIITLNITSDIDYSLDNLKLEAWWNGTLLSVNEIKSYENGVYNFSLKPLFVKSGKDPILFNLSLEADHHQARYYELEVKIEDLQATKLLYIDIVDESFSLKNHMVIYRIYNWNNQSVNIDRFQAWWGGDDISTSVNPLGSGLYSITLTSYNSRTPRLLNIQVSAIGYYTKKYSTNITYYQELDSCPAGESILHVDIIKQVFHNNTFSIQFMVFQSNNENISGALIQVWWNGINITSTLMDHGNGLYSISLPSILILPDEDLILLNMTISRAGFKNIRYTLRIGVDPDQILNSVSNKDNYDSESTIEVGNMINSISLIMMLNLALIILGFILKPNNNVKIRTLLERLNPFIIGRSSKKRLRTKNKLFLLSILMALIAISSISFRQDNFVSEKQEYHEFNEVGPIPVQSGPHSPSFIHIDGSIPDNWSDTATKKPWCWGSGTSEEPYVIENCTIDASTLPLGPGIFINNSKGVHFIIRNCSVTNSDSIAGIYLRNVSKGQLFNNNCSNNDEEGLLLEYCNETIINENIFLDNMDCGIQLEYSNNNTIINNTAKNTGTGSTQDTGLGMYNYCNDNLIENNLFMDNEDIGIYLWHSGERNTVKNNVFMDSIEGSQQEYGIRVRDNCKKNNITGNIFNDNSGYGISLEQYSNENKINNNFINISIRGLSLNDHSCENLIYNNVFQDCDSAGIAIQNYAEKNIFSNNTALETSKEGAQDYGIYITNNCNENNFTDNIIEGNIQKGISLTGYSHKNIFKNNTMCQNEQEGLYINTNSDNTDIISNIFYENGGDAILIRSDTDDNTEISSNIFISADNEYIKDDGTNTNIDSKSNFFLIAKPKLDVEIMKKTFNAEKCQITFNISNDIGLPLSNININAWWDGSIINSERITSFGAGLYNVSLDTIYATPMEMPTKITFKLEINAKGFETKHYEMNVSFNEIGAPNGLFVDFINETLDSTMTEIRFRVSNWKNETINPDTIYAWWNEKDITLNITNLDSGLYQISLSPMEETIPYLLKLEIAADGYTKKRYQTTLQLSSTSITCPSCPNYLHVELVKEFFSEEIFNITFAILDSKNDSISGVALQAWWNGLNISRNMTEVGDGHYLLSITPSLTAGENHFILNISVIKAGYSELNCILDLNLDSDVLKKSENDGDNDITIFILVLIIGSIAGGSTIIVFGALYYYKFRKLPANITKLKSVESPTSTPDKSEIKEIDSQTNKKQSTQSPANNQTKESTNERD